MGDASELTDRERDTLAALQKHHPATRDELVDELGLSWNTIRDDYIATLREHGYAEGYDYDLAAYPLTNEGFNLQLDGDDDDLLVKDTPDPDDFEWVDNPRDPDPDPDADDLTPREQFIVRELQTGASLDELADELDTREGYVKLHLDELQHRGWPIYQDTDAGHWAIEGDHPLRSSEHIGTRTRKANKWWELRHNELVREFRALELPSPTPVSLNGNEDWILHLTDVHVGDRVRTDDGTIVYSTDRACDLVDYVTDKSLALADLHPASIDQGAILWGGDMITNEGIYEGQFEDLDAWLDEQLDSIVGPLLRQVRAFADRFPHVQVVAQTGNHGEVRASGTSRQANADLILYKHIRNLVAAINEHADGVLDNVSFVIGEAKPYRNFDLRGGKLRGHLRHGQDRRPQAETSARRKEWLDTILDHAPDVAWLGHHHVSGRIPWNGPPIIASGSPKPPGEFVEKIAKRGAATPQRDIATAHGLSDDGLTAVYPIDTRDFDP